MPLTNRPWQDQFLERPTPMPPPCLSVAGLILNSLLSGSHRPLPKCSLRSSFPFAALFQRSRGIWHIVYPDLLPHGLWLFPAHRLKATIGGGDTLTLVTTAGPSRASTKCWKCTKGAPISSTPSPRRPALQCPAAPECVQAGRGEVHTTSRYLWCGTARWSPGRNLWGGHKGLNGVKYRVGKPRYLGHPGLGPPSPLL